MAQKIIIMDYSTIEVHVYDLPEGKDGEEFLIEHFSEQGETFKASQCNWMVADLKETEDRLPIYIH